MPEWLLEKDDYIPQKDKDAFINKSILSILNTLTRFRLQTEDKANKFGINAPVKVSSTLLIVILVSLSRNIFFVIATGVFLLLIVSLLNAEEIKYILKMGMLAALFTLIILIPSILTGNKNNSYLIVLKVLISVTTVNILSCTTRWNDTTSALKIFRVPDIFIFTLDIAMKYIVILGEFSLNMLYSLKLRSIGVSKNRNTPISGILGTMFLKSKEMSEEMYGAMECRGFTGEYKVYKKFKIRINDIICILFNIALMFVYFYFNRL
ncbi:MAG: energy-coupling factor transporter transmembrane component T [Clostridiales bacterium]|nr:energy-coupling factor transporter transmembrane component T [Clostridiales bacterium]